MESMTLLLKTTRKSMEMTITMLTMEDKRVLQMENMEEMKIMEEISSNM